MYFNIYIYIMHIRIDPFDEYIITSHFLKYLMKKLNIQIFGDALVLYVQMNNNICNILKCMSQK